MMKKQLFRAAALLTFLFSTSVFAEIAVIVHPSNSSSLDKGVVKKIYLGKTKSFSNGDKVQAFDLQNGSDIRNSFLQALLNKSSSQYKAYWSKLLFTGKGKPPAEKNSEDAIVQEVANNPSAIGYVDSSKVTDAVKVVATL